MNDNAPKNPCYPSDQIEQLACGQWISRDTRDKITARWNDEAQQWERCGPLKSKSETDGNNG